MMNRDGDQTAESAVGEQVLCDDSTFRDSRPPTEGISGPYLRSWLAGRGEMIGAPSEVEEFFVVLHYLSSSSHRSSIYQVGTTRQGLINPLRRRWAKITSTRG